MEISFEEIAIWCRNEKKRMWEFMLEEDMRDRKVTMEESFAEMERIFEAMMDAINTYKGDRVSASGLVGGTGARLEQYFEQEDVLCGGYMGEAMVTALKMAESNACMRRIVAAPTAGSCGVIPAVLVPYYNRGMAGWQEIIKALYVAGCVGEVIAARASISGAEGGCQAEIGSASAMAAGALVFLRGGSDEQICQAVALALKGLLGLVCDPVAGLVEIPCVKRNVLGTVNAISCADMALAGIESKIPVDEVIDAMKEVGSRMDHSLKETALGGLANTKTGIRLAEGINEAREEKVVDICEKSV